MIYNVWYSGLHAEKEYGGTMQVANTASLSLEKIFYPITS